jgi:Tol biopolymer transport system component
MAFPGHASEDARPRRLRSISGANIGARVGSGRRSIAEKTRWKLTAERWDYTWKTELKWSEARRCPIPNSGPTSAAEPRPPASSGRLDSWKEIASYLNRSVRTVTRWEREEGLPVHRHVHSKTGTVYAYRSEIDAWWSSRGKQIDNDPLVARPSTRPWSRLRRMAAGVAGSLLLGAVAWFSFRPVSHPDPPKLIPLTTYPGIEEPPSLSPDGSQVVFERHGDIFVKQSEGEAFLQLTNTATAETSPTWSPDGHRIAFARDRTGIFLISPLGGAERKVAEIKAPLLLRTMAWTPEGESLVISELTSPICASLFLVSVTTGAKKRLTWPAEPSIGDGWPAVSPDGRTLAFARYSQDSTANIYVLPLARGEPRQITAEKSSLLGLAWTPNGKELIFSSNRSGGFRLWRVPSPSSVVTTPSAVEGAAEDARFPSISRPGSRRSARLAYQRLDQNHDIRRAEILGEGTPHHVLKPSTPFIASTRSEDHPQFSPDGKKIAFVSNRSGTWEIWLCGGEGSNLARLTSMGGPAVIGPRWSLDGRRLVFFAATGVSGQYQSYLIDAEGGLPQRLSRDDRQLEALPSWSRDGRLIYFVSGRSGSLQIWKAPVDGGAPAQITRGGGAEALESPDGRLLYYTKVPETGPGLWSIPIAGGEETRVLDSVRFGYWALVSNGIYFIDFNTPGDMPRPVKFLSFHDRQVKQIGTVEKSVAWNSNKGFAVSPDSRWLLYSSLESTEADLMLLDNFR